MKLGSANYINILFWSKYLSIFNNLNVIEKVQNGQISANNTTKLMRRNT